MKLPKLDIEITRNHTADACVPCTPGRTVNVAVAIEIPVPETFRLSLLQSAAHSTSILRLPACFVTVASSQIAEHRSIVPERDRPGHQLVVYAHQGGANARREAIAHVQRRAGQRQRHAAPGERALHRRALQRHATHHLLEPQRTAVAQLHRSVGASCLRAAEPRSRSGASARGQTAARHGTLLSRLCRTEAVRSLRQRQRSRRYIDGAARTRDEGGQSEGRLVGCAVSEVGKRRGGTARRCVDQGVKSQELWLDADGVRRRQQRRR
eukprot:scaffold128882_cov72-Phaeocystis_antarctica.AAC.3